MRTLRPFDLRKNIPTLSTVGTAEDVSYNLQVWLRHIENWLPMAIDHDGARCALIKSKLDGEASNLLRRNTYTTAAEIIIILKDTYAAKGTNYSIFFQLCNLKQVSTISAYKQKFNELLQKREERLLPTTTVALFLQGLRTNIKIPTLNKVKQGKIYTLDQVQQFVDTYEVDSKGSKSTTYEPPVEQLQYATAHTKFKPNTSCNKVKPFFNNNNTNNPAVCQICRRTGHSADQCYCIERAQDFINKKRPRAEMEKHTTFPLKKRPTTKMTTAPRSSQTAIDYMAAPQTLHNHGFWILAQLRF
ncbi:hypothetical protein DFS34DRAFT_606130 [Phlyctochytrium arcticum]|nr:hypothetical protein DFS34DRAFT_640880 [Phlyctochytrium arcticum]KAI9103851.1 hypothetical protein DFS34DRAFT_606130 [Phlyctochytrium arcticum]